MASTKTALPVKIRQVSIPTKAAYGAGQGLISVKNMLFHFFFLFYFSNVLGVSEGLVFIATMIALFVDAFSDPIMGQISDNYRNEKWGRRHKFMLWGIIPTAIALVLLFAPPTSLSANGLFLWMLFFLLVVRIGLTIYGVPYYSLGAELSTNYNERTNIVSVRELFNNTFNIFVFLIGFIIFLPDSPAFEDGMMNQAGYAPFVLTMTIIGVIGSLIAVFGTRHKVTDIRRYKGDDRNHWRETFRELKKAANIRPFIWLSGGYSLILILYGAGSSLSLYMGVYLWQLSQGAKTIVTLAPFLLLIPAVILASVLAAKMDKKPATLLFGAIYLLCNLIPFAAYLMGWLPPIGDSRLMWIIAAFNGLGFLGLTGVLVISNSMLADVADMMELRTGKRQEGLLYAAFSFAQKLTFAVGLAVASLTLMVLSFPKQLEPSQVAQDTIDGLATASLLTALIFGLASLFCFSRYQMTREEHTEIQRKLDIL